MVRLARQYRRSALVVAREWDRPALLVLTSAFVAKRSFGAGGRRDRGVANAVVNGRARQRQKRSSASSALSAQLRSATSKGGHSCGRTKGDLLLGQLPHRPEAAEPGSASARTRRLVQSGSGTLFAGPGRPTSEFQPRPRWWPCADGLVEVGESRSAERLGAAAGACWSLPSHSASTSRSDLEVVDSRTSGDRPPAAVTFSTTAVDGRLRPVYDGDDLQGRLAALRGRR